MTLLVMYIQIRFRWPSHPFQLKIRNRIGT